MATDIRLEFNTLKILKKREKWQLYFLVETSNPTDDTQNVYTVMPGQHPISLTKDSDNVVQFKPEGENTEGMFILERAIPASGSISVNVYLMQSRSKLRNSGEKMDELTSAAKGESAAAKIVKTLGKSTPWIAVASTAGNAIGKILSDVKDRQLGFLSLSEDFQDDKAGDNNRKNKFSTGFAELDWTWSLKWLPQKQQQPQIHQDSH